MRLLKSFALLLCLPLTASAQFANNWILTGQPYLKISVAEDAMYRLTYQDLANAGLPVSSIDPRLIQLYHRGQEQAILFHHDQLPANSQFESDEYLEFFGRRNDGKMDTKLYDLASAQPHTEYNLFSDTSVYFLTWTASAIQGRRMELFDQVNSTNVPKETSQLTEELRVMSQEYSEGPGAALGVPQSFFEQGEGWTGQTICIGGGCGPNLRDFTFQNIIYTSAGPVPRVEVLVAGRDQLQHKVEFFAGPDAGALRLISTKTFNDFETTLISEDLSLNDIGSDGRIVFRVRALGVNGIRDWLSVSYIRFTYPRGFDLASASSATFRLHPNPNGKSYIELINPAPDTRVFDITDPGSVVQIGTHVSGSALTAIIPNTTASRRILCTTSARSLSQAQLQRVTFRDLNRADAEFIIISNRALTGPGGNYADPVRAFAAYRASLPGGGYDTLTVMIDELYDQFNYGEKSPVAVREFMRKMVNEGSPKYLFLIGKGRSLTANYHRRIPDIGELPDLVPPGGSPSSDLVYTMDLAADRFVPAVPVGRLPATTSLQVASYLDKIRETESSTSGYDWQKRVLHLSGGVQPGELTLFRRYMDGFEDIARDKYLGGSVRTLGKHSISTVEFINISKEVNEGVNMVTFFGHSASNITDIDIGRVTDPLLSFSNRAKYPIFLVNGCNAGDFFSNGVNFGEDWILAANKGARSFIANSAFGYESILKLYTDTFYASAFSDSLLVNKGVGDAQVEIARRLLTGFEESSFFSAQVQHMVLLGDPSVRILNVTMPDYETSDLSLQVSSYDDKPIHALSDSLSVSIIVKNRGKASGKPLTVRMVHIQEEKRTERDSVFQSVFNVDTLIWTLRRGTGNFFGSNRIEIVLDPAEAIAELREENNSAAWTKNILFNGTQNLQPPPYAIVDATSVDLTFQDTDLMAGVKNFTIEFDTTALFNSPFKQSYTVNARVLVRKQVTLLDKDSVVYYWRTKPAHAADLPWATSSFAYIQNGGSGFAQLNFDQVNENAIEGLVQVGGREEFDFLPTSSSYAVRTFGGAHPSAPVNGSFQVNDAEYYHSPQSFTCRNNTINLVAFDRASAVPYLPIPFTYHNSGGRSCGREPIIITSFTAAEVETGLNDDLVGYIDEVNAGDSVVLFAMGDAGFSLWSAAVVTKLGELGIQGSDIDALLPGEPVIILCKKGSAPGTAKFVRYAGSEPEKQEIQFSGSVTGRIPDGSIRSVVVGPSLKWKRIYSDVQREANDLVSIDVYGIGRDGHQDLLATNVSADFDLLSVDANDFPRLRLLFTTSDEVQLTPAHLRHWIVSFDPAPDGLVVLRNPIEPFTVQEGQNVSLDLSFVNVSPIPFADSLSVNMRVFNQNNSTAELKNMRIKGPALSDSTHFLINIPTRYKVGLNDISLIINSTFVTEQYLQNNTLELPSHLIVTLDNADPLLDVAVDGRYLINGDFISPNPVIEIRLRDENLLLGKLDTTSLAIFLTYPCASATCDPKRVNFSGDELAWISDPEKPDLKVTFAPATLTDGLYELRVQGYDQSGNASGSDPYIIQFNVSGDPIVSYSPPYPNPSSSGFFFEFQSAGVEAPEGMSVQIFSREGRMVADFDELDAPPLHVGSNRFKWTGLDAHGVALSPGLYLFRMSVITGGAAYSTSGTLMIQY